jgi:hypothetical protein
MPCHAGPPGEAPGLEEVGVGGWGVVKSLYCGFGRRKGQGRARRLERFRIG